MSKTIRFAILCVLLAACGGKSKPAAEPPAKPANLSEAVNAGFAMLDSIADVIESGADCDAKAAMLHDWSTANHAEMTRVGDGLKSYPSSDIKVEVEAKMSAHPKAQALFATAESCQDNAAFTGAWQETSAVFEE